MSSTHCQTCGSPLRPGIAEGLCPRCLMLGALAAPPPAGPPDPAAPPVRIGPFTLLEEIARGGMGIVHRAREAPLGRIVALKLLRGGEAARPDFLVRFHNEARAASSLIHPHIVPVYAFGEDGGVWYIAMRLMEGGSLARWIQSHPADPPVSVAAGRHRECVILLRKLALAVQHAHERGILHRDLKPENVLLDAAGEPYLTDFGLARLEDDESRVTRSHTSLGTPAYVAPEVARGGAAEATVASDVYGLGAVFYEMLTGRAPFRGNTPLQVLRLVTDTDPDLPSLVAGPVDRDLETICLKAMAREPGARYASCAELARDLDRWLSGQPIEARASGWAERSVKWARRRPLIAGLTGLLALCLLVIIVGSWRVNRNLRAASERQRLELVQSGVDAANRLLDAGNPAGSLPSQIAAIRMEASNPARESMHRIRLGLTLPELPRLERVLTHQDAVNSVAFSPDGRGLLSASSDGTARLWTLEPDATSAAVVLTHAQPVNQALFSPDARRILTLCRDGFARLWNRADGTPVAGAAWSIRVTHYDETLTPAASFSPDGGRVITVGETGVWIWDAATGGPAMPSPDPSSAYKHAAFSPDGRLVVAASAAGPVRVWSLEPGGARLLGVHEHPGGAFYALFSPDGRSVASAGADAAVAVWDPRTGRELLPPLRHKSSVRIAEAVFSPAGDRLLSLSFDHSVIVWNALTGVPESHMTLSAVGVPVAKWDPRGERIISGSFDGMARVWDARTGQAAGPMLPHGRYVVDVASAPSGDRIATACMDGRVRVWSPAPGAPAVPLQPSGPVAVAFQSTDGARVAWDPGDGVLRVRDAGQPRGPLLELRQGHPTAYGSFSPSGETIATVTRAGDIFIWDARTGALRLTEHQPGMSYEILAFDLTGARIVTGSLPKAGGSPTLSIRELGTPGVRRIELPNDRKLNHAEFSPDGLQLLSSTEAGVVRFWDIASGREVGPAILLGADAGRAHFSPDGLRVATCVVRDGFEAGQAQLWSAATHQPVGGPMSHEDGVPVCGFTPSGDRLATGSEDGTARIWDVRTSRPRTGPMVHTATVRRLLFSPDARILATGSSLGRVQLWDAETGNALMAPQEVPGGIASMAFRLDSKEFVVVGNAGTVQRWPLVPAQDSLEQVERLSTALNGTP